MTNTEFANEFDIIYENISSGNAPGLEPYEKSVILTQAQESLVRSLLAAKSYDPIADLIDTVEITSSAVTTKIDPRSVAFILPTDYLEISNEVVIDGSGQYSVIPLPYVEYTTLMLKPYKYPRVRSAWKLLNTNDSDAKIVEILAAYGITPVTYKATVVNYPTPIIFTGVTQTIRGVSAPSDTNLKDSLHPSILDHAVKLAEQYYYDKAPQTAEK